MCMAATILIVEDWEDDAKLLERELVQLGVTNPVVTLPSAVDAIRYLEGQPPYSDRQQYPLPAIIFLDLKLPGTDGFEFLDWLKTSNRLTNLMVIAISGVDDLASIRRAYSMGACSFLSKPPHPLDLENLMVSFPSGWALAGVKPSTKPAPGTNPSGSQGIEGSQPPD